MTKRSLCFVFFFVLCLTFCGCVILEQPQETSSDYVTDRSVISDLEPFVCVGQTRLNPDAWAFFYRCRVTDVMYVYIDDYRAGALSVMYDESGLPIVFSEWISSLKSLTIEP